MTKNQLIRKYEQVRIELNNSHSIARKKRHESVDPQSKADYELDQESCAAKIYVVDQILYDLKQLNVQDSLREGVN